MSQATKTINAAINTGSGISFERFPLSGFLPAILPIIGAALMVTARIKLGPGSVPHDGTLVVIAVLCYITAAASLLTNFWASNLFLQRLGLWTTSVGFFFNFSGWLVRWVNAGDREQWVRMTNQITGEQHFWWFFSYIPFTNLYDLSVAFAFGATFATLLLSNREATRFVGAISLPLVTLILFMAIFIGDSFINLPPVLDSYWRPIHVGVASLSYGVALVSFALAVVYLLKDGVKPEAMGVAATAFFIVGYIVVWIMGGFKAFDLFSLSYRLNPVVIHPEGMTNTGARVALPGVGIMNGLLFLCLIGMAVCFLLYLYKNNEAMKRAGHWILRSSLGVQGVMMGTIFYQVKNTGPVGSQVGHDQSYQIGFTLLGSKDAALRSVNDIVAIGANFLDQNQPAFVFNIRSNPVEMASLITIFVVTLFIILFSFRTERLRNSLPSLDRIDGMIYKTIGVAFAGLAILLITGAIWANESWGRAWAFDPKETGALVAWLSYAGYLHTRIAHGWSGRRSAYFALIGFLLIIFTYLGVSYILPGLHAYA
jgi:ABC-type transport system involved in cytochrome c biogenesis permease subunit